MTNPLVTKNRTVGTLLTILDQDVYTVPALHTASIESIFISNIHSGSVSITVDWYDSKTATYKTLLNAVSVANHDYLQLVDCLYLVGGDKIRASAASDNHACISIRVSEEYTPNIT